MTIYRLPADTTLVCEFPALALSLQDRTGESRQVPTLSVYLPTDYRCDRTFPLVVYLQGGAGGHGGSPHAARRLVGNRGFICATMPLYKGSLEKLKKDKSNFWSRMYISDRDSASLWKNYRPMLHHLFTTIPNIDRTQCYLGGFSNGAHSTVALLNRAEAEIRRYFTHFLLLEGGAGLKATPAIRGCPIIILQGEKHETPWLAKAHRNAKRGKAKTTFVLMKGIGHAIPRRYELLVRRWIRSQADT